MSGLGGWLAGVAATVVAGVVGGLLTDWYGIGGPPNRAVTHVTAFTQYGNKVGTTPTASITVENEGKKTAENCVVHWQPGMTGILASIPEEETSDAFALDAGASRSWSLSSRRSYGTTGTYVAKAWIACSNSTSRPDVATIYVLS
jgi:hypothetical protein